MFVGYNRTEASALTLTSAHTIGRFKSASNFYFEGFKISRDPARGGLFLFRVKTFVGDDNKDYH